MQLEEALKKIDELTAQVETLTADSKKLAEDKADISKNFDNFRKLSETKEKELSEKLNLTSEEYTKYKGEKESEDTKRRETFRDKLISEKARGDKALIEKIQYEYKNFNLPEMTEDEIKSRVEKASAIHTSPAPANNPNPSGGGGNKPDNSGQGADLSPNAQALHNFLTQ